MYAQHDEEAVIDALFPHLKAGTYVDIGAGGAADSNTYKYYQMGWSGLLVEPRPDVAGWLRRIRPRDTVVQAAISDLDGEAAMYHDGDLTRLTPRTPDEPVAFRCPCLTTSTLLEEHPEFRVVDLASMDVEGDEDKVIASTDFRLFAPTVLIVEYNTAWRCADSRDKWEQYLLPLYEPVYANGVNAFYVRRALEKHGSVRSPR